MRIRCANNREKEEHYATVPYKSVEQTIAETGEEGRKLKRNLTWWDLSIMGVAVAVGAGIFSVGAQAAAFHAGPAVIISFLIAGVVCGAAVMCYAEFASMIPVAGSAYTFTYTTVGEIMAGSSAGI